MITGMDHDFQMDPDLPEAAWPAGGDAAGACPLTAAAAADTGVLQAACASWLGQFGASKSFTRQSADQLLDAVR
jgi:hypothetical protein